MPKRVFLVLALLAIILLPLAGSLIRFGGSLPPGYGDFPSQKVDGTPGFNPVIFWVGVAVEAIGLLFLAFPRLFGFRKPPKPQPALRSKTPFPWWFWFGAALFAVCLGVFWGKEPHMDALDPVMFVPIWWGMILVLDGWVFRRKNGHSLLANRPQTMLLLAVISGGGWFLFEYIDFFTLENWYYPNNHIFTPYGNIVWFLCSYTIIFPQLFETYQLFETIPGFAARYSLGPKIPAKKATAWIVLTIGVVLSVLMGLFPYPLFFTIWVNPVLIMLGTLSLIGIWTVFTPLKDGNWAPLLLSGMAMVLCGLSWELVNFGSEFFFGYQPVNPSYWKYSVPYVGNIHLPFSEMPILGYGGYVPYAWVCWLQWGLAAKLFGFEPALETK